MGRAFTISLTLTSDAVFTKNAATVGGHEGLDYIPGSVLYGWAAGRLYKELGPSAAYTVFHSGKVRFGNGLPVTAAGRVAFPMPQCLMEAKHERNGIDRDGGKLAAGKVQNYLCGTFKDGIQPEVLKGYVAANLEIVTPKSGYRMKTAIEEGTDRAAEGQLFGYAFIPAGRRFVATIDADDDVADALFGKVNALFDSAILRLGRSRKAEFGGLARSEILPEDKGSLWPAPPAVLSGNSGNSGNMLTLWLLSDLAPVDDKGVPVLAPEPWHLGLCAEGEGKLRPEKSFIAVTRRYSPFNAWLQRREGERAVIAQGSVLSFEFDDGVTPALSSLAAGVGLYREQGLGRVWAEPAILAGEHPQADAAVTLVLKEAAGDDSGARGGTRPAGGAEVSALVTWLQVRDATVRQQNKADEMVKDWRKELAQLYETARAISANAEAGPGKSQWGRVQTLCSETPPPDRARICNALFQGAEAICRTAGWSDECVRADASERTTFGRWLKNRINAFDETQAGPLHRALGAFANWGRDRAETIANTVSTEDAA